MNTVNDHRAGAALVLLAVILWLGRARWKEVGRALLRSSDTEAERRNRRDGWMFLFGMLGMAAWFIWAGAAPDWAFVFVVFLGWLSKVMLLRYGGSQTYRAAKPVFLGMIFGELLATVFWCVMSVVLTAHGDSFVNVSIRP